MSMTTTSDTDALLERYLILLHKYFSLRSELNSLQAEIHQSIARANFSAGPDRGPARPYGQHDYDERMRASVTLAITLSPSSSPTFTPVPSATPTASSPLRQFGLLTAPAALRAAHHTAATHLLPRLCALAALDAEMRALEIDVRRARKRARRAGAGIRTETRTRTGEDGDGS